MASVNSDEAVSSTNRLKSFYGLLKRWSSTNRLKAVYGPLMRLKTAAIEVVKPISEALVSVLNRSAEPSFIPEFHQLLSNLSIVPIALIGLHFQGLAVSPLHTHSNIILPFIAATIVYQITYMLIKLQAEGADPILRIICLVSGIISIELLYAIFLSPFQLIKIHLYLISLMLGGYCLFYTANFVLRQMETRHKPGTPDTSQELQTQDRQMKPDTSQELPISASHVRRLKILQIDKTVAKA